MPRIGAFRQLDPQALTPFARLIYDYLVAHRPTLLVSELAEMSGISNNAIWSWLKHGIIPRRQTIVQLAERVPELAPLDDLLAAAGLPLTAEIRADRREEVARFRASVALFARMIAESQEVSPEIKRGVAEAAHLIRQQPDELLRMSDTYREYNEASPAEYLAERSMEEVMVYEAAPITTPEEAHGVRPTPPLHGRRRSDADRDDARHRTDA